MKKFIKKSTIASAILALTATYAMAAAPIHILSNETYKNPLSDSQIKSIVENRLNPAGISDLFEIKVQTIFNPQTKQPDHLLVYELSSRSYSLTITKIALANHQVTKNYHLSQEDIAQQPDADQRTPVCPDPEVEFVAATPVPTIKTAFSAVKNMGREAKAYGYVAKVLLDPKTTIKDYVNYLSCPALKGFYNVGHGSPDGILLSNGMLTHQRISTQLKDKLRNQTVVLFNSCEVFKEPLKPAIITDANAQKYAGGQTPLLIGPSELASQCFWNSAFGHLDMTPAMDYCNKHFDTSDVFGIDGTGTDTLNLPDHN